MPVCHDCEGLYGVLRPGLSEDFREMFSKHEPRVDSLRATLVTQLSREYGWPARGHPIIRRRRIGDQLQQRLKFRVEETSYAPLYGPNSDFHSDAPQSWLHRLGDAPTELAPAPSCSTELAPRSEATRRLRPRASGPMHYTGSWKHNRASTLH